MTRQTCNEIEPLWDRYLNGDCSAKEEQMIEDHLKQCPACQQKLAQATDNQSPILPMASPMPSSAPSDDQQRRWMRRAKWKNRIISALNLLGIFLSLSILTGIGTTLLYGWGGPSSTSQKLPQVLGTAVGMTMPNLHVDSGGVNSGFYFNLSMEYSLSKQVGKQNQTLGKLHGNMWFNMLRINREWHGGGHQSGLYFQYPGLPVNHQQETDNDTWQALEMLPEGTVSELALSLDAAYSLNDIYSMFENYDMEIIWYAFDTGLERDYAVKHRYLTGWSGNLWGMSERLMLQYTDLQGGLQVWGDGPAKEQAFQRALEELQEHARWVRKIVGSNELELQERIDYVKIHGSRSYGLIVTGPTKELLKLREHPNVSRVALGETDWWNWYPSPYSSTMH